MTYVVFLSSGGVPAVGLTPSIDTLVQLDGDAVVAPAVTEISGGFYSFSLVPAETLLVVVDGGAGLADEDRYIQGVLAPTDAAVKLLNGNVGPLAAAFANIEEGIGVREVVFTVLDEDDAPIEGVDIDVWIQAGGYVTSATTDADGEATVHLLDATYLPRYYKAGVSFTATAVVVNGDEAVAVVGGVSAPDAPASPALCRVYVDVVDLMGEPRTTARATVENLYNNPGSTSPLVGEGRREFEANDEGRIEMDLVRGSSVRISLDLTPFSKAIIVPDTNTVDLASIVGSPPDSFTPVIGG